MSNLLRRPWVSVLATTALLGGLLSGTAVAEIGGDFASGITNIKAPNRCRVVQTEMDVIRDTKVAATLLTKVPGTYVENVFPKEGNDRLEICLNQAVSSTVRVAWMAHNGDSIQGIPGADGLQGPPGPSGVLGTYTRSSGNLEIPANQETRGIVAVCDAGDFATGAGWSVSAGLDDVRVSASLPGEAFLNSAEKWQVVFERYGPVPGPVVNVAVFVQCLDLTE